MAVATGLYAAFTILLDIGASGMSITAAYLLTRPGVLIAGVLLLGYSTVTPTESRVLRDLESVRRHIEAGAANDHYVADDDTEWTATTNGILVFANEGISFFCSIHVHSRD